MQTYAFDIILYFSNLSLIIPPISVEINPKILKTNAFATAKSL
jgi:hypothetical protein